MSELDMIYKQVAEIHHASRDAYCNVKTELGAKSQRLPVWASNQHEKILKKYARCTICCKTI
jgi:hypothetical protein